MLKRWMAAVGVLALVAPITTWAGTLQFFEASAGAGNTRVTGSPGSGLELDIDYDASSAESGTLFGFALTIISTGDLTIDGFTCQAVNCLGFGFDPPDPIPGFFPTTSMSGSGGDDITGQQGVQNLGLLTISGSVGNVEIQGGNYFDPDFPPSFERAIDPFVLASTIPEPSTWLLLGAGLAGLAFLRGRSA